MSDGAPSPRQPQLPTVLDGARITELNHDVSISELELSGISLADGHANGVTFETVKLSEVDLSGSRLEHLRITEGVLARCNLANVHARKASIRHVTIEGSRMTGIDFSQGKLIDVMVRDCRVDLATFSRASLERVTFEDCLLTQTDFLEARLDGVRFHACDLAQADYRGARLKHCEFRRSDLTGLQGVESLRGAGMEWTDIVAGAGVWAAALGIDVLDGD